MRVIVLTLAAVAAAHSSAVAQTAERVLTPLEVAVACAPPPSYDVPTDPLRIIGVQDTVRRVIYNTADLLIIGGGTDKGVQLGQQYFVRRPLIAGTDRVHPSALLTLGWLRVVAVNDKTAIAKLDRFCNAIFAGDYLEPYAAPELPANAESIDPAAETGELNFETLNRILGGVENQSSGAGGSLMLIDRGEDQETTAGMRFAVYRDVRSPGLPLASVGEGIVLSVGKTMSLARITRSRDAVIPGDYIVPRK
jgi:hypothetical protein